MLSVQPSLHHHGEIGHMPTIRSCTAPASLCCSSQLAQPQLQMSCTAPASLCCLLQPTHTVVLWCKFLRLRLRLVASAAMLKGGWCVSCTTRRHDTRLTTDSNLTKSTTHRRSRAWRASACACDQHAHIVAQEGTVFVAILQDWATSCSPPGAARQIRQPERGVTLGAPALAPHGPRALAVARHQVLQPAAEQSVSCRRLQGRRSRDGCWCTAALPGPLRMANCCICPSQPQSVKRSM